jgi:hypothetical protein
MPEPQAGGQQIVGLMMIISALTLVVLAGLIYLGTFPMPDETRPIATLVIAFAAFLDFCIGVWFFRKGQSS